MTNCFRIQAPSYLSASGQNVGSPTSILCIIPEGQVRICPLSDVLPHPNNRVGKILKTYLERTIHFIISPNNRMANPRHDLERLFFITVDFKDQPMNASLSQVIHITSNLCNINYSDIPITLRIGNTDLSSTVHFSILFGKSPEYCSETTLSLRFLANNIRYSGSLKTM